MPEMCEAWHRCTQHDEITRLPQWMPPTSTVKNSSAGYLFAVIFSSSPATSSGIQRAPTRMCKRRRWTRKKAGAARIRLKKSESHESRVRSNACDRTGNNVQVVGQCHHLRHDSSHLHVLHPASR